MDIDRTGLTTGLLHTANEGAAVAHQQQVQHKLAPGRVHEQVHERAVWQSPVNQGQGRDDGASEVVAMLSSPVVRVRYAVKAPHPKALVAHLRL